MLDHNTGKRSSRGKAVEGSVNRSHRSGHDFNSFLCLSSCVERPLVIVQLAFIELLLCALSLKCCQCLHFLFVLLPNQRLPHSSVSCILFSSNPSNPIPPASLSCLKSTLFADVIRKAAFGGQHRAQKTTTLAQRTTTSTS